VYPVDAVRLGPGDDLVAVTAAQITGQAGRLRAAGRVEVFAASAVAAPYVHYKRAAVEHPEDAEVAFTLNLVAKDLELLRRLAERAASGWSS
jgi:hypothetical protein